ncbi:hypothetical protein TRIP_B50613 [uncultured Desulfatiglans sp.]|uniref:Uncharacterized protein n=1 Tax=Uncultured Desulfatiglans sp. TaxID=1748965 RepID=A0A653AIE3_UNCDX|nr:hypothetical protein TRIP_B50613 [uncultured Desulfatiglans sp.]
MSRAIMPCPGINLFGWCIEQGKIAKGLPLFYLSARVDANTGIRPGSVSSSGEVEHPKGVKKPGSAPQRLD